eukprot:3775117-Rhodomonas_salina.2
MAAASCAWDSARCSTRLPASSIASGCAKSAVAARLVMHNRSPTQSAPEPSEPLTQLRQLRLGS